MKKFLTRHKFKVWLTALIPFGAFIPSPIGSLLTLVQISALVTMFWIGWDGIFDNI